MYPVPLDTGENYLCPTKEPDKEKTSAPTASCSTNVPVATTSGPCVMCVDAIIGTFDSTTHPTRFVFYKCDKCQNVLCTDHYQQFQRIAEISRKCNQHHPLDPKGEHIASAKNDHCFSRGHNRSSAKDCLNHKQSKKEVTKMELAAAGAGEKARTFTRKAYLGGVGSDNVFHRGIFNPDVSEVGKFAFSLTHSPFTFCSL